MNHRFSQARAAAAFGFVCACVPGAPASAQGAAPNPSRPASRFEVAVGAIWTGSGNFGTVSATETVSSGPRFVLFSTRTQLDSAAGLEARVGFHLTRIFEMDAVASYSVPQLSTTISSDAENASPATQAVGVKQFAIGGAVVAHLTRFRIGANAVPFVEGGIAYLRQVYDAPSPAASGAMYDAGGGVKYTFRRSPGRRISAAGVRADVRAVARRRGVAPDGGTHVSPAAGASLFLSF
jgi:opacity protein-like surface antigen